MNDNVVKMPDLLERLAQRIDAALGGQEAAIAQGRKEAQRWRDETLVLAVALAEAKTNLNNNDQAFGKWCAGRFGDNRININDRAALVRWGADPEGTRVMLSNTDSQSVQVIDRRFCSATKPRSTPVATTPKRQAAAASIRAYTAVHGVTPTVQQAVKASGLSRIVIEPALATVKAEDNLNPPPSSPTKTANAHHEAILKIRLQELEKTFEARVQAEYQRRVAAYFPDLQKRYDDTARKEKIYMDQLSKRAVFTKTEYIDILFCVRNEHVPQDRRDRATIALEAQKLKLVGA